jgi:hypothetical protein
VDLLEDTTYPDHCPDREMATTDRLQHALVTAFGLQRREPSNLFNDHRSSASVRSRFPVHAFVQTDEEAWLLDVYRHGLLPVAGARPQLPTDGPLQVALAGRYTHLPSLYGRLRGPLVELEMGIGLRALWVALELLGLAGQLHLPAAGAAPSMAHLGLDPPTEWTVPLPVTVRPQGQPPVREAARPGGRSPQRRAADTDDPTLAEVVAVNRTALDVAVVRDAQELRGEARAIPAGLAPGGRCWAEVMWQRSAGHMPRQLAGFSGRRRPLPAGAVSDALAWVAAPPPTPLLAAVADRIKVSVCLQDAIGYTAGWYRLDQGELQLVHADPSLAARLEGCYGHGLGPNVGCAVRHASLIWLLAVDVTGLVEAFGPGGWTLAQYACGWMAHGLCLAAAAAGLYARPSRAFDELLLHPVVGGAPGEMVLLSVISGAGRYLEPVLDLRT